MIRYVLLDKNAGQWAYTQSPTLVDGNWVDPQVYAAQEEWEQLDTWGIWEEWKSTDPAPLGWNEPVVELIDGRNRAARYPAGTQEERNQAQRELYATQIDTQRGDSNQRSIDIARDPGLNVLMDEANTAAEAKLEELDATADENLGSFDPTLDNTGAATSQSIARSMVAQEAPFLNDPSLTTAQITELQSVMVAQQAVADGDDPEAEVPEPPSFLRRKIGIVAEDYGSLIARREDSGGWNWLTFELRTERELDVKDYWIAVYDETAADDRDDTTTGYLTTPRLTETDEGVYVADRSAVNLPASDNTTTYKYTLCYQNINFPQFDKLTIRGGRDRIRRKVRWSGRAGPNPRVAKKKKKKK